MFWGENDIKHRDNNQKTIRKPQKVVGEFFLFFPSKKGKNKKWTK